MIQATDKITIALEAQQWQAVVNLLSEGPFKVASVLIANIQEQFNQQVQSMQMNGNGIAAELHEPTVQ